MATRTVKTGDDVDAALSFLGRQSRPQVSGDEFFLALTQKVIDDVLKKADDARFSMVKELMDDKNKGESISKLRELLGV